MIMKTFYRKKYLNYSLKVKILTKRHSKYRDEFDIELPIVFKEMLLIK